MPWRVRSNASAISKDDSEATSLLQLVRFLGTAHSDGDRGSSASAWYHDDDAQDGAWSMPHICSSAEVLATHKAATFEFNTRGRDTRAYMTGDAFFTASCTSPPRHEGLFLSGVCVVV